ncbi:MAG: uroporphyrinogen-III C-methyltransferase [Candidatus Omnitrophica bacterium]|nr:uroporphyrinogen-III C-methyltransferase [Candidatus Omnitrophota bacterium]
MPEGKVYLIGAGPGDAELLTLKGLRFLKEAEVVIYDRLINPELLRYIPEKAEVIYVGKSADKHTLEQNKINRLLVKLAKQGKKVVRLKGGDPFLFGRGAEEALFLAKHRIDFEVVPGISSAISVPAYAGIPLTHRNYSSSVGIFTGQEAFKKETINWEKVSTGLDTLVFLMGVRNLEKIVNNLIKFGRPKDTPCCLIRWGTIPKQKSIYADLKTIIKKAKEEKITPPAVFVVGKISSLRKKLNWYEKKKLFGKKILITSPLESFQKISNLLRNYGASCLRLPILEVKPIKDPKFNSYINRIKDFDWIIFTSQNAVKFFKEGLNYLNKDMDILKEKSLYAIGPETKRVLENFGLRADIPKRFCQEGLIDAFRDIKLEKKKILIVCSQKSRKFLSEQLKKLGAEVKVLAVYRIEESQKEKKFSEISKDLDLIVFTSPSCVRGYFRNFKQKGKIPIASIGPVTSQELLNFGFRPDIQAKEYTFEGLVKEILNYFHDKYH